ncbi:hypothetical protein RJ639_031488 [Escallonia herrerae]|uniref:Auxin-responsive protein n=1 Tax=Escallonia herrerae TaxID=1293975 RepID=A0AA89BCK5_9ASTE|nr:hypothetical protein RJ639_031488 [Escallonia herrerae]
MEVGQKRVNMLGEDETELRLGLPGGGGDHVAAKNGTHTAKGSYNGKRGFNETMDLKLKLSSKETAAATVDEGKDLPKERNLLGGSGDSVKPPPAKAQVVGWPPVRSFRRNILAQKSSTGGHEDAAFVKVSMDGAPYLRKVDLKMYKSYQELSDALGNMFSSFTIGTCGSQGMKDFMNESKLMDLLNSSDYVPSYEDKDGDWMHVGDVPWEMFVDSCKRLRIMKGTEAIGLAPRAMEKCKNRS